MIRIVRALITACVLATATLGVAAPVYLDTPEGEQRLISAGWRQPFFAMQPYVETQQNLAFCGPASIVAVMNSLGMPRPAESRFYPYAFYTQDNIFNAETQKVKSFVGVSTRGMTLAETTAFFRALGVEATAHHADSLDQVGLRKLLQDALANPNMRIVANYDRKVLAQDGAGHISPLAAYDAASDSALLLDVAKFKYPPAWVGLDLLLAAMRSVDADSGLSRGLVLIERRRQ